MAKLTGNIGDFLKFGVAAAGRGDLKSLKSVLKQRPHWHKHVGSHGRTMLWEASHKGKLETVKFLVEKGADIHACGSHYTPYFIEINCLCAAALKRHDAVAEFLALSGAKSNIHMAAFLGKTDEVKKHLARSPRRINMGHKQHVMAGKNNDGLEFVPKPAKWATPLCYALRSGNRETVEFLLFKGAIITGFEEHMFTAANGDYEMVRVLLENGAETEHAPRVCPSETKMFKLLESYGVKISQAEIDEEFVYSCRGNRGGAPDSIRTLLKHGAKINYQDSKGKTALHRAAKAGFVETVKLLLQKRASVYVRDQKGETALFDAVRSTIKKTDLQIAVIDLLVDAGADLHAVNRKDAALSEVARKDEIKKHLRKLK